MTLGRIGCTRVGTVVSSSIIAKTDKNNVTTPLVRTPRLVAAYRRYLHGTDAPQYAGDVNRYYSASTLATVLGRGDVEMRRAAAMALGLIGDRSAIEPLGRAISDPDRGVRLAADDSFRALAVRDAAPLHHQQLLKVMHLNDGGEFGAALSLTMILVDQAPMYAEAYHQLGVCYLGLDNFDEAEAALCSCLWQCRYHYPAWQGLARCKIAEGDLSAAIHSLDRALEICPDLESARVQIRAIRRQMKRSENG